MIPTDEIISMAREAGFTIRSNKIYDFNGSGYQMNTPLNRFAQFVSARAAAIERESCAKVCDVEAEYWRDLLAMGCAEASDICATEIRSRKS